MTLADGYDVTITQRASHWIACFDASHHEPRLSLIERRHRLADFKDKIWFVFLLIVVTVFNASELHEPRPVLSC